MKKRLATLLLAGVMAIGTAVPAMADTGKVTLPTSSAMRSYDELSDEERTYWDEIDAAAEAEGESKRALYDTIQPLSVTGWKVPVEYHSDNGFKNYPGYTDGAVPVEWYGVIHYVSSWFELENILWAQEWVNAHINQFNNYSTDVEKIRALADTISTDFDYDEKYSDLLGAYSFRDKKYGASGLAFVWACRAMGIEVGSKNAWNTVVDQNMTVYAVRADGELYWSDPSWFGVNGYGDRVLSKQIWDDVQWGTLAEIKAEDVVKCYTNSLPATTPSSTMLQEDDGSL